MTAFHTRWRSEEPSKATIFRFRLATTKAVNDGSPWNDCWFNGQDSDTEDEVNGKLFEDSTPPRPLRPVAHSCLIVATAAMMLSGCSMNEPEPPPVPDVTGLRLDDAHDTLDAAGFENFEDRDALGKRVPWIDSNWAVVRQEPLPDRSSPQSDSVILYVAKPEDEGIRELLPESSPVLAELEEQDERNRQTQVTEQSTSTTDAPPPPEGPTFRYSDGHLDESGQPALPPVPDLVPRVPGTARVEVSGAWSGTWESTSVNCAAYGPGESSFRGWEYVAGPSVGGESALDIRLDSKYADGPDEGRLRFDPDVSVAFRDADSQNAVWEANGSGADQSGEVNLPQAAVEVSLDRSTVSFGAVAVAHSWSFSADYNRVGWVVITGTLTCAGALPEVGE